MAAGRGFCVVCLFTFVSLVTVQAQRCRPKLGLRPFLGFRNISSFLHWASVGDPEQGKENITAAAELGVMTGSFSLTLLNTFPEIQQLYMIDLWAWQENYKDIANVDNDTYEQRYRETLHNVAPFREKVQVLRMSNAAAAKKIPDSSLDLIFIDARHDYCGLTSDLWTYWGKLKVGGIMFGDCFMEAFEAPGQDWGVCEDGNRNERAAKGAVEDFVVRLNLDLYVTYEGERPAWFLRRKCNPTKQTVQALKKLKEAAEEGGAGGQNVPSAGWEKELEGVLEEFEEHKKGVKDAKQAGGTEGHHAAGAQKEKGLETVLQEFEHLIARLKNATLAGGTGEQELKNATGAGGARGRREARKRKEKETQMPIEPGLEYSET